MTLEIEKRAGVAFFQNIGCLISGLSLNSAKEAGYRQVDLTLVGRNQVKLSSSAGGTPPTQMVRAPLRSSVGLIKLDGSQVGEVLGFSWSYQNSEASNDEINGSEYPAGYILDGVAQCNGDLTVRYKDETFYDRAQSGAAHLVELEYAISGTEKIVFSMPGIRFEKAPFAPISGPGGLQAQLNWRAEQTASDGMVTITVTNSIDVYDL